MVEEIGNNIKQASLGDDDKVTLDPPIVREVKNIQPQLILYPPSHKKNKIKIEFILQTLEKNAMHTYNTRNNPQLSQKTTSLPLDNTVFPSAPCFPLNSLKEYDLVEKLKNTLANISICDLIQNSHSYRGILKNSLQKLVMMPYTSAKSVVALVQGMSTVNVDITFHKHELPPL